jgi:hypothetical protein
MAFFCSAFTLGYSDDCDAILLQSGEEINAKVLKISDDEIEYKKCDNLTGATYSLKSAAVFMIKFANGSKQVITKTKKDTQNTANKERKPNIGGGIGLLTGFLILAVLAAVSWYFAIIASICIIGALGCLAGAILKFKGI